MNIIHKKKNSEHCNKYSLFIDNIELILSLQELYTNKNNYEKNINNKKNLDIFSDLTKLIKENKNIKSISFWLLNNNFDNYKFIKINNVKNIYEIIKIDKIIYLVISNNKNNETLKIKIDIESNGFFIINFKTNSIVYNNKVIYNDTLIKNKRNDNDNQLINFDFYKNNNDNYIDNNIFNNIDELIFYNIELNEDNSEYIYNIFGSYLKIINLNINTQNDKIKDIENMISNLNNLCLNIGNVNFINDFKNKIKNTLNNKDILEIKQFEEYSKNIQKHSNLILDNLNSKINVNIDKYILSLYNSLKIILNCYNRIKNFYETINNLNFVEIDNKIIDLTNNIIKLKSYKIIDSYTDNNGKVYNISNNFNFLFLYEESIFYFYNGLPTDNIIIDNVTFYKSYSDDNLLIKKDDYINLFSIDVNLSNKINNIILSLNNQSIIIDNNNLDELDKNIGILKNSNNKLENLFNVVSKNLN